MGRCPGPPEHTPHQVLQGFGYAADGHRVWLTELAAEYPEGLCDALASAYRTAVTEAPVNVPMPGASVEITGVVNTADGPTAKTLREVANKECIGGLRAAFKSMAKVPGWEAVGRDLGRYKTSH